VLRTAIPSAALDHGPRCHLQKCRATARASFARAKEGLQETLGKGTSRKDLAADQAREEHRLCRVGVERPDHDDVTCGGTGSRRKTYASQSLETLLSLRKRIEAGFIGMMSGIAGAIHYDLGCHELSSQKHSKQCSFPLGVSMFTSQGAKNQQK
jgi:hypothetical protein